MISCPLDYKLQLNVCSLCRFDSQIILDPMGESWCEETTHYDRTSLFTVDSLTRNNLADSRRHTKAKSAEKNRNEAMQKAQINALSRLTRCTIKLHSVLFGDISVLEQYYYKVREELCVGY